MLKSTIGPPKEKNSPGAKLSIAIYLCQGSRAIRTYYAIPLISNTHYFMALPIAFHFKIIELLSNNDMAFGYLPRQLEIFDAISFRDNVCWCTVRKVISDSMCEPSFTVVTTIFTSNVDINNLTFCVRKPYITKDMCEVRSYPVYYMHEKSQDFTGMTTTLFCHDVRR